MELQQWLVYDAFSTRIYVACVDGRGTGFKGCWLKKVTSIGIREIWSRGSTDAAKVIGIIRL
jgi:hypothetical protein